MPATMPALVEAQVAAVKATQADALKALGSTLWTTTQEENALRSLQSLSPSIERWANLGRTAAAGGTNPGNGWPSWHESGARFISSIGELYAGGSHGWSEDAAYTVARAPAVTGAVLASGVRGAAGVIGDAGGSLVKGILGVPGWAIVLGVAGLYMLPKMLAAKVAK